MDAAKHIRVCDSSVPHIHQGLAAVGAVPQAEIHIGVYLSAKPASWFWYALAGSGGRTYPIYYAISDTALTLRIGPRPTRESLAVGQFISTVCVWTQCGAVVIR